MYHPSYTVMPPALQKTDPDAISPKRAREAQEIYQELQDMETQLRIWEMIIDFLGSGDFIMIILTIFIGIALVKSVGVVDRYVNGTKKEDGDG